MKILFSESTEAYSGEQLHSLYAYMNHGLLGNSIISWVGACNVPFSHMVDGEDLRNRALIQGDLMVHFIIEIFDMPLLAAVSFQRLFAGIVLDVIREKSPNRKITEGLKREGDDLFFEDRKLSISIATVSPVSALIHFAVNVSNQGTPVKTLSLGDLSLDAKIFAEAVLNRTQIEFASIKAATQKVKWVK